MNEWREKVALKVQAASNDCRFTPHINSTYDADQMPVDVARYIARAAIAELLPLMKAELAKVARSKKYAQECVGNDQELILHNATCEGIAATIEAWEPE